MCNPEGGAVCGAAEVVISHKGTKITKKYKNNSSTDYTDFHRL
jgi:hypothetical protein